MEKPFEDYIPVLRSNNIKKSKIDLSNLVYVKPSKVKEHQFLKEGDILITASTGSLKVIGKNAYCEKDYEASFGAFCKVVRPKKNISSSYLKHMFQSVQYFSYIQNIVNGANINNIKNDHINNFQIPIPPIATQKHIAEILDKAAALRDKTKQLLEEYDKLIHSIFFKMFGDPAFNNNKYSEVVIETLVRDKNDIKCGPFGTQLSKSEYVKEGIPVWGIPQVNSNFEKKPSEYVTENKAHQLESFSVKPLDIVMSRKGNVGSCAIYPKDWSYGILHSDVLRIRCDVAKVSPFFLAWQFRLNRDLKTQVENVSSGAIMAGINVSKLKKISPILPPVQLQNKFAERVALIEQQKELAKQELKESEDLFQALLQKAFKGELIKEKNYETA